MIRENAKQDNRINQLTAFPVFYFMNKEPF